MPHLVTPGERHYLALYSLHHIMSHATSPPLQPTGQLMVLGDQEPAEALLPLVPAHFRMSARDMTLAVRQRMEEAGEDPTDLRLCGRMLVVEASHQLGGGLRALAHRRTANDLVLAYGAMVHATAMEAARPLTDQESITTALNSSFSRVLEGVIAAHEHTNALWAGLVSRGSSALAEMAHRAGGNEAWAHVGAERVKELQAELAVSHIRAQSAEDHVARARVANATLEAKLEGLQATQVAARSSTRRLGTAEQELASRKAELASLQTRVAEQDDAAHTAATAQNHLLEDVRRQEHRVAELTTHLARSRADLDAARAQISTLSANVGDGLVLATATANLENAELRLHHLAQEATAAETRRTTAEGSLRAAQDRNAALEQELAHVRHSSASERDAAALHHNQHSERQSARLNAALADQTAAERGSAHLRRALEENERALARREAEPRLPLDAEQSSALHAALAALARAEEQNAQLERELAQARTASTALAEQDARALRTARTEQADEARETARLQRLIESDGETIAAHLAAGHRLQAEVQHLERELRRAQAPSRAPPLLFDPDRHQTRPEDRPRSPVERGGEAGDSEAQRWRQAYQPSPSPFAPVTPHPMGPTWVPAHAPSTSSFVPIHPPVLARPSVSPVPTHTPVPAPPSVAQPSQDAAPPPWATAMMQQFHTLQNQFAGLTSAPLVAPHVPPPAPQPGAPPPAPIPAYALAFPPAMHSAPAAGPMPPAPPTPVGPHPLASYISMGTPTASGPGAAASAVPARPPHAAWHSAALPTKHPQESTRDWLTSCEAQMLGMGVSEDEFLVKLFPSFSHEVRKWWAGKERALHGQYGTFKVAYFREHEPRERLVYLAARDTLQGLRAGHGESMGAFNARFEALVAACDWEPAGRAERTKDAYLASLRPHRLMDRLAQRIGDSGRELRAWTHEELRDCLQLLEGLAVHLPVRRPEHGERHEDRRPRQDERGQGRAYAIVEETRRPPRESRNGSQPASSSFPASFTPQPRRDGSPQRRDGNSRPRSPARKQPSPHPGRERRAHSPAFGEQVRPAKAQRSGDAGRGSGSNRSPSPTRKRGPVPEGTVCHNCGKPGHWRDTCREARRPQDPYRASSVMHCASARTGPTFATDFVRGVISGAGTYGFLVDSGSSLSFVSLEVANAWRLPIIPLHDPIRVQLATGQVVTVTDCVKALLRMSGVEMQVRFRILPHAIDPILGSEWLVHERVWIGKADGELRLRGITGTRVPLVTRLEARRGRRAAVAAAARDVQRRAAGKAATPTSGSPSGQPTPPPGLVPAPSPGAQSRGKAAPRPSGRGAPSTTTPVTEVKQLGSTAVRASASALERAAVAAAAAAPLDLVLRGVGRRFGKEVARTDAATRSRSTRHVPHLPPTAATATATVPLTDAPLHRHQRRGVRPIDRAGVKVQA